MSPSTQPARARRGVPRALRPLVDDQFRRLAGALVASLLSVGVWLVASVWQVVQLGGDPSDLSLVATAAAVGLVSTVLVGGAVADRVPQRSILLVVESLRAVCYATAAALSLTGVIQVWQLAALALVLGMADGFFFPAYSAWLPSLLAPEELLAANGLEGMLRPTVMQAAGPALASLLIAVGPTGLAFAVIAAVQVAAVVVVAGMRSTPVRRDVDRSRHPLRAAVTDIRDGFAYMVRTRWLLATLLFAVLAVLAVMGPVEVLLPFAVKNQTGGGAGAFALALAVFGAGGAIGSLVVASVPLPRRYLTFMLLGWGVGSVPIAVIGLTSQLWLMAVALFVAGFCFSSAQVVWGTLLQRRVPPAMLGRVSSLDFFVSLALMPVSMALAGPVGEAIGLAPTFLVAGLAPAVIAVVTLAVARLGADERAHPMRDAPDADPPGSAASRPDGAEPPAGSRPHP